MRPLKLQIPGKYWDSLLYEGRLYLFQRNGDVLTVSWDRLVDEFGRQPRDRLVMISAFLRSDLLYQELSALLLEDAEIREMLSRRFDALADRPFEMSQAVLEKLAIGKQHNPFPFPHSDIVTYGRRIYAVSGSGVFRATCNKRTKYPIASRCHKEWDGPVLAVDASYGSLALAAGDEGLFELVVSDAAPVGRGPTRVASQNCADCNWTFYSIYGSSHTGRGYLAAFTMDQPHGEQHAVRQRKFERVIPENEIFHETGYSWGNRDRLYQAIEGTVRVSKYLPDWGKGDPSNRLPALTYLGEIQLARWKGRVISGGVSLFGIVIECQNAIVVVPSEGESVTLPGEPVNWRVFPRSRHYENQLHVIYDDRLEIYSFNQDYSVSQADKRIGFTYFRTRSRVPLSSRAALQDPFL